MTAQGKKSSQFPTTTQVQTGAFLTYIADGVNYKISHDNFISGLGVTGSIVQEGDPTGTPVLEIDGSINKIRNAIGGAGIVTSVSPLNGLQIDSGIKTDTTGIELFDDLSLSAPTIASLDAGSDINLDKTNNVVTISVAAGLGGNNRVLVKQASDLAGTLDSNKEYFIDGVIDMGAQDVEIPTGGLTFSGYNFVISGLTSSEDNYTMFKSAVGGCGTVIIKDMHFTTDGTNSQVMNLTGATGAEAIEFSMVNFNNCSSLGSLENFRQGLEFDTGRFGGSPNLKLKGTWDGYRITTSIVRGLDAGTTGALFEDGGSLIFSGRFLTDMNVDLSTSVAFLDFAPANFLNPSTLQINDAIVTRNGASDPSDANLTPNISSSDLESAWNSNQGLTNTHEGGKLNISAETATVIGGVGVFVDVAGTWDAIDLQHFDEPVNGQLRHLGNDPRSYSMVSSLVIEGTASNNITVKVVKWDDSASGFVDVFTQTRVINNVVGGDNVGYWNLFPDFTLDQNDYIKIQVANNTSTDNVTAQVDSFFKIARR